MAAVLLTAQDVRPRPMAHGNGADSPQIVKRVPWVAWTCSGRCGTRLWGARKAGDCPNRPQAAGTMCAALIAQWQSVATAIPETRRRFSKRSAPPDVFSSCHGSRPAAVRCLRRSCSHELCATFACEQHAPHCSGTVPSVPLDIALGHKS